MSAGSRSGGSAIPVFSLYGERDPVADAEFIHIEDIPARSARYAWEIGAHTHQGLLQVLVLSRGVATLQLDDAVRRLDAPGVLSIPPATVHGFRFAPQTDGYVLTIAEAFLHHAQDRGAGFVETLFSRPRLFDLSAMPGDAARITGLAQQIEAEFHTAQPGQSQMQEWLVCAMLTLIARQDASPLGAPAEATLFNAFRALVERHYLAHWSVSRYAAALKVSESKLNRTCRIVAGKSAFEVARDRLVLEARRKLAYIAAPVSLLAYELGFEDPAYFWRFFRRQTGLTPTRYRARQRAMAAGARQAG